MRQLSLDILALKGGEWCRHRRSPVRAIALPEQPLLNANAVQVLHCPHATRAIFLDLDLGVVIVETGSPS